MDGAGSPVMGRGWVSCQHPLCRRIWVGRQLAEVGNSSPIDFPKGLPSLPTAKDVTPSMEWLRSQAGAGPC